MGRLTTVCLEPGCSELTNTRRCAPHRRQADRARGTRAQRGYDATHDRLRRRLAPKVAAGRAICARCGERIEPGTPWDLGHTDDRNGWTGPEHASCNRSHRRPTGGGPAPTPTNDRRGALPEVRGVQNVQQAAACTTPEVL